MKKIADVMAYFFITAVVLLGFVSILGVWNLFEEEVIAKSFATVGVLGGVALIIMIAQQFMKRGDEVIPQVPEQPSETFTIIRLATLTSLITSGVLLALSGILAIWEVLEGEVLYKSLASLAIIAFASFIIVSVCFERENRLLKQKKFSGGLLILFLLIGWIVFHALTGLF